jgi:hypothetical protein
VKDVNMNSPINWNALDSKILQVRPSPKWHEVSKGLLLVAGGYLFLIMLALPGTLLLWLIFHDGPLFHPRLVLDRQEKDILFLPVPIALCGVVLVGFGMVVAGKLRCLTHATQHLGAKELMLTCITCSLAGVLLFAAAHFCGGLRNYLVFEKGLGALDRISFLNTGTIFQLAGAVLAFGGSLLFCQFQKTIARYFENEAGARRVDVYFLYVCLMVGGSIGVFATPRLAGRGELFLAVAGGWVVCILAQVVLMISTRRCIAEALEGSHRKEPTQPQQDKKEGAITRSGLHRVYKSLFPSS